MLLAVINWIVIILGIPPSCLKFLDPYSTVLNFSVNPLMGPYIYDVHTEGGCEEGGGGLEICYVFADSVVFKQ